MPLSSLPTGTVSPRRGDRARTADTDPHRQPATGSQRLAVRDGGTQSSPSSQPLSSSRDQRGQQGQQSRSDEATAERIDELEAQVEALERELARREADQQEIVHRYEHVLSEARSLPERRQTGGRSLRARLFERLAQYKRTLAISRLPTTRRQTDDRPLRERLHQLLPWR